MSTDNELWQVLLAGEITDIDLITLRQWVIEGKVQKTDKVRKNGGGSWSDAARTPALRGAFSSNLQQQTAPPPPIQVETNMQDVAAQTENNVWTNQYVDNAQYANNPAYDANQMANPIYPPPETLSPQANAYAESQSVEQPSYLPSDYVAPEPTPEPPSTGTVFQGEAPPQKFLQPEALPAAFREKPKVKRVSLEDHAKKMRSQQSLVGLIGSGLGISFVCAGLWGIVALATSIKSPFVALPIGYLVGDTVRRYGKCYENTYGAIAGIFAILASFLGQLVATAVVTAQQNGFNGGQTLGHLELSAAYVTLKESFGFFNLVLYLISAYISYYFCFRTDTDLD
ncbi:MAG: hypothetical protein J0M03_11410 [Acidobacteria bacterium]|nr:hypothetical protein [Acidobacteriota bacterium]